MPMLMAERLIDESRPPIIAIVGATASGKTGVALEMPGGEAICADRFTAWDGGKDAPMEIGIAKPTKEERARMPHHLINLFHLGELIRTPEPGYVHLGQRHELSVMRSLALAAIDNIGARGNIPIIVGGSTSTLTEIILGFVRKERPGYKKFLESSSEENLRKHCESFGLPYFEYENSLDAIRRKIYGIWTVTGKQPLPNVYPIGVKHNVHHQVERADARLDQMWDEGLPEEIQRLVDTYGWVRPLTEAIGYKEFMPRPDGKTPTADEVRKAILKNTIGFIWAQSSALNERRPIHWASSIDHAVEIGRWVIEQYKTKGIQAAQRLYATHSRH